MTQATGEMPAEESRRWLPRALLIATLLTIAWLLWSGFFKPLLLGLGALSVVVTIVILRRMGYFRDESFAFRYDFRLLGYWAWLGGEVIKSSIDVTRIVLSPTLKLHPKTLTLDVSELNVVDQATLGNSITLTPGTLTLDVYKGRMLVHALSAGSAAGLEDGEMQRRVAALRV